MDGKTAGLQFLPVPGIGNCIPAFWAVVLFSAACAAAVLLGRGRGEAKRGNGKDFCGARYLLPVPVWHRCNKVQL